MSSKSLTTDQKIDLILNKVTSLEVNQKSLEKNQQTLEKNQQTLEKNQKSMQQDISDLVDMATETLALAAKTADRVSHIETHLTKKSGFTPFTSGAFAA